MVRDALLGRQGDYVDLDFVLPEQAIETAQKIAHYYRAGFVVLDAKRQIARVVFDRATVDFALQEGATLEVDLQRRDFTVNAIAYDPHTQQIIDPLKGYEDLQHHRIRMITRENLKADPLRLLRAYRQAAQLNFDLDPTTQFSIRQLVSLLKTVAPERVQSELNYLLANVRGAFWLSAAWEAGLLCDWLPNATQTAMGQIVALENMAQIATQHWPKLELLYQPLQLTGKEGYQRTGLALAKLAVLLAAEPEQAEKQWHKLKGSRAEVRSIGTLKRLQPQMGHSALSIREQYVLFQEAKGLFPVLALLGLVQLGSSTDSNLNRVEDMPNQDRDRSTISPEMGLNRQCSIAVLLDRFFDPDDRVAHPQPILRGKELMQALDLSPGPHIGHLLTELQIAQASGKITTREEAIDLAQSLLNRLS